MWSYHWGYLNSVMTSSSMSMCSMWTKTAGKVSAVSLCPGEAEVGSTVEPLGFWRMVSVPRPKGQLAPSCHRTGYILWDPALYLDTLMTTLEFLSTNTFSMLTLMVLFVGNFLTHFKTHLKAFISLMASAPPSTINCPLQAEMLFRKATEAQWSTSWDLVPYGWSQSIRAKLMAGQCNLRTTYVCRLCMCVLLLITHGSRRMKERKGKGNDVTIFYSKWNIKIKRKKPKASSCPF